MTSIRKTAIIGLTSLGLLGSGMAAPAFAAPARSGVDAARLDKAPADYTQYRRWHRGGNRGAAIAAGVGLGILGAAAVAGANRAYADPYYDEGYYAAPRPYYAPAPVYYDPPPVVYERRYYRPYDFRDHR